MVMKTLQITITVDDVGIQLLEEILESVDDIFELFEFKRIDVALRDEPMIRPFVEQARR